MTYYCPSCWSEIERWLKTCPHCGADLSNFSELPYEEKLLKALHHPIRENRRMAIQVLGELHAESAIPELQRILEQEEDIFVVEEALKALHLIGTPHAQALLQTATKHHFSPVRRIAIELVGRE